MYCMNCGVKLADSEKNCPLCGTTAYHPELSRMQGEPLYPTDRYPVAEVNRNAAQGVLLILFLLPIVITLLVDWRVNAQITWSAFVVGAVLLCYIVLVLPSWFRKPNPVIFVPCDFAAVGLYLFLIDLLLQGHWFLSFAFPVVGSIGIVVTTVVTLLRYVRRGKLFIFGGATMALGGVMLLMEFLICITFGRPFVGWSLYPLIALVLLGGGLIYLGINHNAREMMERKLFI